MSRGRAARLKGKVGERQTADDIRKTFPEIAGDVRRGWQARDGAVLGRVEEA